MPKNSLNDKLEQDGISKLVASDSFAKLNENVQIELINSMQNTKKQEGGFWGRLFGTKPINVAMNIAFTICALLFLVVGIDFIRICIRKESFNMELFKTVIPVITLSLGYIFGKGFDNNK